MTRRRISAFVDAVLANRRPRPFAADPEDAQAMRSAIGLRAAQPGASLPRAEFVADLHERLRSDLAGPIDLQAAAARHVTRRGLLAGAAAAAAAAVAGAVVDHELLGAPSSPAARTRDLVADRGEWKAVAATSDLAQAQVVRFTTKTSVGFISKAGNQVRAVSGVCSHQGCLLAHNQKAGKLDCPCHRASFALSGEVLNHEFPTPLAPLPRLPVREQDGRVEVFLPPEV